MPCSGQLGAHPAQFELDDLADLLLRQRVEDDRRVDPVQELGLERLLELRHHLVAHLVVIPLALGVSASCRAMKPRFISREI